jgi:hypothetical protein
MNPKMVGQAPHPTVCFSPLSPHPAPNLGLAPNVGLALLPLPWAKDKALCRAGPATGRGEGALRTATMRLEQ